MALYPPQKTSSFVVAPSPDTPVAGAAAPAAAGNDTTPATPGVAGQFTKHEAQGGLRRQDLDPRGPALQFHTWFAQARAAGVQHPEACTLSTASLPSGRVTARVVYLKELDADGQFVLYSNFGTSQKAKDLETNPWASLTFFWEPLERQVRVEGRASRLTAEESQVYYDTRVRGSRVGAWASRQSSVLEPREATGKEGKEGEDDGRAQLEGWVDEMQTKFAGQEHIPVPPFWGGLRIVPERIEFWQGRQNRLHDRFVFDKVEEEEAKSKETKWKISRLSP